ncbi:MAG: HEAT repeat domain-containing protein, partial [Gemmataceae bacterium]|nr:HEAT repeat domain-containing protein [Gemmataceae bacterium]
AKAAVGLRRAALMSLGKVTSDAKVVWPAAQGALQDADPTLRGQAVRVAGPLGKVAKEVIPTLEKLARKDANIEVRIAAIQELGALGAAAKAVERTLSELAESDPRPTVREAAQAALKQVRAKASP